MPLYRPRMMVRLYVPNVGSPQDRVVQEGQDDVTMLQVRCHKARLESNNHNEADEVDITICYDDAGIDPRFLRSAEVYLYLGDGDENGDFAPSLDNLRFIGIATDVERVMATDPGGKDVRIRALDYTTLFLACKHFPRQGIPDLSLTLLEAWHRICDNTGYYDLQGSAGATTGQVVSTVARLRDRIEFHGLDAPGPVLGSAVSARLAKLGKLQVHDNADAWAVWQTAVGSVGLISYIRGDRCIVTTATDYYTSDDPPRLIYGQNVTHIREARDGNAFTGKNVALFSFDPLSLHCVEAYWPPIELAVKKKKTGAGALGAGVSVRAQDYEVFDYQGGPTMDATTLQAIAKRVWEERSRQELTGEATTSEMFVDTLNADRFDMLKLAAGDRVRIEIEQDALTLIQQLDSEAAREAALVERGYSADMAHFIALNLSSITSMPPEFQVHSVTTELDVTDEEGGRYETQVRFLNRIDPSGAAQVSKGDPTNIVPMTGQTQTTDAGAETIRSGVNRHGV